MHIRRGDACAASVGYRTPCQPLEAYLRAAEALAARYDVSEVARAPSRESPQIAWRGRERAARAPAPMP
jgi:hypothetical protein